MDVSMKQLIITGTRCPKPRRMRIVQATARDHADDPIPPNHQLNEPEYEKLCEAIRAFLPFARESRWSTHSGAWNKCMEASDCFLHELERVGLEGEIEYYDFEGKCCTVDEMDLDIREYPFSVEEDIHRNHWAVRVGNIIIDWTARQFNRTASFPAIWVSPERRPWRNCED
jgi:hypothetical protein